MTDQTVPSPLRLGAAVPATVARFSALAWPVWLYLFTVLIPLGVQLGPLTMTSLRFLLILLILPLSAQLLAGSYGRLRATDIFFLLYVLWTAVAIIANNPGRTVEYIGSTGVEFLGGYVVARAYIRTPEAFEALARVLILFLVVTLPFTLVEAVTGRPPIIDLIRKIPGIYTVGVVTYEKRMGLERVQLSFAHPIHFGLFCSMVFSLAFVALKGRIPTLRRYAVSAIVGFCCFLSLSSGPLLALILQLMLIGWNALFAGLRPRLRWYLLIALFVLAYVVIDLFSNRTPIRVFMSYATFSAHTAYIREQIFDWGMKNVWGSPIFGIGLRDWIRAEYMVDPTVDNFWLLTTMRFGFPGLGLLVAGYAIGIAQVMRQNFDADPKLRQYRLAWVFTFLGLSFTLTTVAIWTSLYSFVFFMFGAGIWLIAAKPATAAAAVAGPRRALPVRVAGATGLPPSGNPVPVPAAAPAAAQGPRYTRFPPQDRGRRSDGGPDGGGDPPAL